MTSRRLRLPRSAQYRLLVASWTFSVANGFSAPVLGLYLFTQSSLIVSAEFYLVNAASILATYIAVGEMSGRIKSTSSLYRPGLALLAAFYALLIALGDLAARLFLPLAVLYGVAQGLYWSGWDIAYYEFISDRLTFFNRLAYLGFVSSLVVPAVYGAALAELGQRGYVLLFGLSTAGLAAASYMMPGMRPSLGRFSIKGMVTLTARDREYGGLVVPLSLLFGYGYSTSYINSVLTYTYFGRSYRSFAVFNYAMSVLAVIVVRLRRRLSELLGKRRLLLGTSLVMMAASAGAAVDRLAIPAYLVTSTVFSQLVTFVDVDTWNSMKREDFAEYMTNRHLMLNSGRGLATAVLIATLSLGSTDLVTVAVSAFAVAGSLGYSMPELLGRQRKGRA